MEVFAPNLDSFSQTPDNAEEKEQDSKPETSIIPKQTSRAYWVLLCINYFALFIGSISSTLLSRFYFAHGGKSRWLSTWVQSSGFPLLLIPIYLSRFLFPNQLQTPFSCLTRKLLLLSLLIGLLMGVNNCLFSWGISYLSVSTSSLLISCQLAFNLILSVVLVKQKVTYTNMNCVVLLTLSSVLLALGSNNDRPENVTRTQFYLGFLSILGAALLFALYLPLMEMIYRNVSTYSMVMEMQVVMEITATAFSTVGMIAGGGFKEMRRESVTGFDLGAGPYWLTVGFTVISWQLCFMGTAGIVFLTTSLTGGICMTALLPMNVVGGVITFGDHFSGDKAVSTILCLWGFLSYLYGMYVESKKAEKKKEKEMEALESGNAVANSVAV